MAAYYNEFDPFAAAWLRELIREGLIAPGDVDERSIKEVQADDLRGYAQCHFFAGIGVWSHALRRAGWEDDRPVWTGSCPCQPFSSAGKGLGFEDPRHLWPDFLRLIAERRPNRVFGEQSANAGAWVDLVRADLEARGYAFASPDIPAAGFAEGAHIRQRFYWVADADDAERWADLAPRNVGDWPSTGRIEGHGESGAGGDARRVGNACGDRSAPHARNHGEVPGIQEAQRQPELRPALSGGPGQSRGLADTDIVVSECATWVRARAWAPAGGRAHSELAGRGSSSSLVGADWLFCRDGFWRPTGPDAPPLAAPTADRVGRLRGYGNALDAETATRFIGAFMEAAELRDFLS